MAIALREHTDIASGALDARTTKLANNAKIAYALFTGIVKDKIGYAIREYAKNAWEVSPPGKPFLLELPTRWNPKLRIRDYGPGLSHHFMMHRYPRLGDSTKDGQGIGGVSGWGFGSKSALAYLMEDGLSGSYTVISYREGTAAHYIISLSEGGMPTVKHFMDVPTEEPDGLEVSFAVREEDFRTFEQSAREILWSFEPRPTVVPDLKFREPRITAQGDNWTMFDGPSVPFSGPQVRVGPVMYPIDMSQIEGSVGFLQPSDDIIFDMDPDAVSPTASREALQYTGSTKRALSAMVQTYEQSFIDGVQTKVNEATCYFGACSAYREVTRHLGVGRASQMRTKLTWGGQPLRTGIDAKVNHLAAGWSSFDSFRGREIDPANVPNATVVIEHNPYYSLDRFIALDLVGKDILWARVKKPELEGFLAMCALKPEDVIILDEAPLSPRKSHAVGTRNNQIRRRRTVTVKPVTQDARRYSHAATIYEDTSTVDLEQGGLVLRKVTGWSARRKDNYLIDSRTSKLNEGQLTDLMSKLVELNIITEPMQILVDTGVDELSDDWSDLGDWVRMRIEDRLDQTKLTPIVTQRSFNELPGMYDRMAEMDLSGAPADMQAMKERYHRVKAQMRNVEARVENEHDRLFSALMIIEPGLSFPRTAAGGDLIDTLIEDFNALMKKYPLFSTCNSTYYDGKKKCFEHYFALLANQK